MKKETGVKCVACGGKTQTLAVYTENGYVRRRKECAECGILFSTYEFTDETVHEIIRLLGSRKKLNRVLNQLPWENVNKKKSQDDHF